MSERESNKYGKVNKERREREECKEKQTEVDVIKSVEEKQTIATDGIKK